MTKSDYVGTGGILYLLTLIVSVGNWFFWIVITQLTSAAQVGQAVIIISLSFLVVSITQLGFDYTLVKKISKAKDYFSNALLIELGISLASLPIILLVIYYAYDESVQEFTFFIIGIIVLSSFSFVTRFSLLGISDVRNVVKIDLVGMGIKLVTGFALVSINPSPIGIITAFVVQFFVTSIYFMLVSSKRFGFKPIRLKNLRELVIHSLVNTPSRFSRIIIINLSVVFLPFFGIADSSVGIYYIAIMISIVVASFASNIAFMTIPSFSNTKKDLSADSTRIGLSITTPFVTALIVAPLTFLSYIGEEYAVGVPILSILGISIFPYIITMNLISKLNNLNKLKNLILLGTAQISSFIISFFIFVPAYEINGAAISILISFTVPAIISAKWMEKTLGKNILISAMGIGGGWLIGFSLNLIFGFPEYLVVIPSVIFSALFVLAMKNISLTEIKEIFLSISKELKGK